MIKRCPACEKEFETDSFQKVYCSYKCFKAAYYRRKKGMLPILEIKRSCAYCGKEFTVQLSKPNQKYCSPECLASVTRQKKNQRMMRWYRSNREVACYQRKYQRFFGRWLKVEEARKHCRRGQDG